MTEESSIRQIEIDGVRMEIDLRTAKTVESYKVGDRVKLLLKEYSGYKSHPGVIVGLDNFKSLPTIVIAYVTDAFGKEGDVKLAYLNSQSKDTEICPMTEDDLIPTRDTLISQFDRAIGKKIMELQALEEKKEYFLRKFGMAFESTTAAEMPAADG